MKMSKLELFLVLFCFVLFCFVLFPVDYLTTVLIPKTNKRLSSPIDLGKFITWVGCWFYNSMVCWVGVQNRKDWWASRTEPSMYSGTPFRLG
jgi:hypothetical protein